MVEASFAKRRILEMGLIAIGLAGMLMLLTAAAGTTPARAVEKPFTIEFDQSRIEAGFPGDVGLDALSGTSSIEGTIDGAGNIKIPKGSFQLPVIDLSAMARSLAGVEIPVEINGFMSVEQAATGAFDRSTGKMEIQTKAGIWVSIDIQQLLDALDGLGIDVGGQLGALTPLLGGIDDLTCGFSPMDVTFTTESTSPGTGQRFTRGLEGPGALTGEWSQLGPFAGRTKILVFDVCSLIRSELPSLLSGLGGSGGGIDPGDLDIAGLLDGLDDLDLGPGSLTISRTLDGSPASADRARLKLGVARKKRAASRDQVTRYRVTVENRGGSAASGVRVCAQVPRRSVRGGRCLGLGAIRAGKKKRATFKLRLEPGARKPGYPVSFRAKASGGISIARTARIASPSR